MTSKLSERIIQDQALLIRIQANPTEFRIVYNRCKPYCRRYVRSRSFIQFDDDEFNDIYHDSCLILLKRIGEGSFLLTSTFQTFLNATCENILDETLKLTTYRRSKLTTWRRSF